MSITQVKKRNGLVAPFDRSKIEMAIGRAFVAQDTPVESDAIKSVVDSLIADLKAKFPSGSVIDIEDVQDAVELALSAAGYFDIAKAYIIYREKRSYTREVLGITVPEKVSQLADDSKKFFKNPLGEFVYYRTYSRWIDDENRRETWIETVDRYMDFMKENLGDGLMKGEYAEIKKGILEQEAMPSMRLLQFAGPAAKKTNVCAYNCSYIAPEKFQDLAEIMYVSMCGTGVGFSVESRNVEKFPVIAPQTGEKLPTHVIPDSKEGWADALVVGMKAWGAGKDIDFDYSHLRPSGTRLKTMGGKASGPEPIMRLLVFVKEIMLASQGQKLRNIDLHDIICMIGDCVVSGGVRRSAMISLSDLNDSDIRDAKKGQFYVNYPHRMLSNNSATYNKKPTAEEFMDEWIALMKSGSGERGIFNRGSLAKTLPERRIKLLSAMDGFFDVTGAVMEAQMGTNPCGEIILQSKQFCNLSEVVARSDDTEDSLLRKVRLASILGTYQGSLTDFPYLSKPWGENCRKEVLLGVSLTGQWDCPILRDEKLLQKLRDESIRVNKKYSKRFGINESTCITCVKPSGTLSQMVDCSSGMHPRHAQYYIRRIRIAATDSLFKMLRDQGVPFHPEVGQNIENATTFVLEFPVKAPKNSVFKNDLSAIDQLEHWKLVKVNYTEHNPSVTVSIGEDEWIEVANWVYKNWDIVGGISFLPRENHVYQLAPYEEITKERYSELSKSLEHIDYSKIITYESIDNLDLKKELACAAGVCEIM